MSFEAPPDYQRVWIGLNMTPALDVDDEFCNTLESRKILNVKSSKAAWFSGRTQT